MKRKITAVLTAAVMAAGSLSGVYAAEPGRALNPGRQNTAAEITEEEPPEKPEDEASEELSTERPSEKPYEEKDYTEEMTEPEISEEEIPEIPSPEYEKEGQEKLPFEDINENAWYYDAVSEMYSQGLIPDSSEKSFRPEENITGIELLSLLYRADEKTNNSNDTRENVISWAKKNNILSDNDEWKFEADKSLTREQVMVIVYRYMLYKGINIQGGDLSGFSDSGKVSSYAEAAAAGLVSKGVISSSSGTLRPDEALTRAEAAAIIVIVINLSK